MEELIKAALKEDIGSGDITTNILIGDDVHACARIIANQKGVICGVSFVKELFHYVDRDIEFIGEVSDGDRVQPGTIIAKLSGKAKTLLSIERVALNLLQHLSGVATQTSQYVEKVKNYRTCIIDTRKTIPGLRILKKYAVRCGGGRNHRVGLFDGVLIKDNHIDIVGGVAKALRIAKENAPHNLKIEVEVRNLDELKEALKEGPDIIMLDNMEIDTIKEAVKLIGGRAITEVSGGVNLDNVEQIAKVGVDLVSIGALTHSAGALDISMDIYKD